MKSSTKKLLCIILTLVICASIIPFAFADSKPTLYVDYNKAAGSVDIYFEYARFTPKAEYTIESANEITVTDSKGYSFNEKNMISVLNNTGNELEGSVYFYDDTKLTDERVLIGSFSFTASSNLQKKDFSDIFTFKNLKLKGVAEEFDIVILGENEKEEASGIEEIISEINKEPISEIIEEPTSQEAQNPEEPSSKEDITPEEPEIPVKPQEPIAAAPSVYMYVYQNKDKSFYGVLSLDCDGADSISFDIKPYSNAVEIKQAEIIKGNDLTADFDNGIISVSTQSKDAYGFVKMPLKLTSKAYPYTNQDKLFSLDYCFINGKKQSIPLNVKTPEFNPVEKSESFFTGFDSTFNTYDEAEEKYYSYKIYAVGYGFAADMSLKFDFDSEIEIIMVDSEAGYTADFNNSTVSIGIEAGSSAEIEYTPVATVFFKYTDKPYSYKDVWKHCEVTEFTLDSVDCLDADNEPVYKAYLGYNYHYDTVDGIKYVSYDYNNKPKYTSVCGYIEEEIGEEVIIPGTVRKGYVVASIDEYAFENCTMKSITLPDSIEKLEANAFKDCTELYEIAIPKNVYTIGAFVFDGCKKLTTVSFNNSDLLEAIGENAFVNCESYKDIILPDGSYSIGSHAFGFTFENGIYLPVSGARILYKIKQTNVVAYVGDHGIYYISQEEAGLDLIDSEGYIFFENKDEEYFYFTDTCKMSKLMAFAKEKGLKITKDGQEISENTKLATGMKAVWDGNEYDIIVKGDTNGDGNVSAKDAKIILRAVAKLETLDGVYKKAADLDKNGSVKAAEARRILKVVAKLDSFN